MELTVGNLEGARAVLGSGAGGCVESEEQRLLAASALPCRRPWAVRALRARGPVRSSCCGASTRGLARKAIERDAVTARESCRHGVLERSTGSGGRSRSGTNSRAVLLGGGPAPEPLVAPREGAGDSAPTDLRPHRGEAPRRSAPRARGWAGLMSGVGAALPGASSARGGFATARSLTALWGRSRSRARQSCAGYFRDPVATAETIGADGWLRTRDLGQLDAEGNLTVHARRTDLILSGGENVYPVEVENALLAHPGIADVAVVGVPDARWGQVPAAFYVAKTAVSVSGDVLHAHCRERLAGFKCPKHFVAVAELPRRVNGKVDRSLCENAQVLAKPPLAPVAGLISGAVPRWVNMELGFEAADHAGSGRPSEGGSERAERPLSIRTR